MQLKWIVIWYFAAYAIVTSIGIAHTVFNITVRHMGTMRDGPGMGEGYERTRPWHPLYNLLVFPLFAGLCLPGGAAVRDAAALSLLWGTAKVVLDVFGWVLIRHPWSLSFREFYVDYQPWITLIYLTICASPFMALLSKGLR